MFILRTVKNQVAFEACRKAFIELLSYAKLAGLTLFGEAIGIEEDDSIDTMCTDGKNIYYAPKWVLSNTKESITFDGLHEWSHIFGNHVKRRGSREPKRWGYAADVRVAHDCLKIMRATRSDWKLAADHVPAEPWAEMLTVEEIYDRLPAEDARYDKNRKDLRNPKPQQDNEEDDQQFKQKFADNLAQAVAAIELSHGNIKELYGDAIHDRLTQILRGSVPWGRLLGNRLCKDLGHQKLSWLPPNRRYFPELILPSLRAAKEKELILGVDVSASIDEDMINLFATEIGPAVARARRTTIATFDERLREIVTARNPREALRALKFTTGAHSHTSVIPLFELIEERRPSAVAILTDGFVALPPQPYPNTHWVIPRGGRALPWGHNYFMEQSW